jgi:septal ring factor EnvC (AmiA/AmiB activator)
MASDPTYLAKRYRKLEKEMEEARKKREKRERKEARKLMIEQQKHRTSHISRVKIFIHNVINILLNTDV